MEVPVVASYDRHGVALGLFYSSAADIPLLSPVPTGGEPSQRGTHSRLLRQAWGRLGSHLEFCSVIIQDTTFLLILVDTRLSKS